MTKNQFHVAEDQKLAQEQQVEANLQTYLDRMSELLLNPSLHSNNQQGINVRILATARTLTILQDLDGSHKATVLKFLHSAGLITRYDQKKHPEIANPVVNLNGADFSGVNLSRFILSGADLAGTILANTDLSGADLSGAYLPGADLSRAKLSKANLRFAQLFNQQLNLPPEIANLTGADLTGAFITNTDFTKVTWNNTTCPDGTKSDTNSSSSCVGHSAST